MNIDLTDKEFRRLLDLVYIGNWILNSTRTTDRFEDYDIVQEKLFSLCAKNGMKSLIQVWHGHIFPSRAYEDGGIHEAIADYEDAVFSTFSRRSWPGEISARTATIWARSPRGWMSTWMSSSKAALQTSRSMYRI